MRLKEFITEGRNHPCIVVDVQPEYSGIHDGAESQVFEEIIQFVNRQTGPVLMFVNAEDQGLSGDTVNSIEQYWNDTICPEEERYTYDEEYGDYIEDPNCPMINWNRFTLVDKGYGYLRAWMTDNGDPAVIIKMIRKLYQEKENDSRMLFGGEDDLNYEARMREFVGPSFMPWMLADPITVNWTSVAQLKRFNGAYLMGGGRNECLREVELLMNAFNIRYKRIDSLVYGD